MDKRENRCDLIGKIITIFNQNMEIKEQLEKASVEIKDFFDVEIVSYFAYFKKLEHIFTIPYAKKFIPVSDRFLIKCELEEYKEKDKIIYNIPIKDSFSVYGVLQLIGEKKYDEKFLQIIGYQFALNIRKHRMLEGFQKKIDELNREREHFNFMQLEKERKFFYAKLIQLVSKIFITTSKRKILQHFAAFLMYNNFMVIEQGVFYFKNRNEKFFRPFYCFDKNSVNFVSFNDALEGILSISYKDNLKKFPSIKNKDDFLKIFPEKYFYKIGETGYFVSKKNYVEIKFLLKLIEIAFECSKNNTDLNIFKNKLKGVAESMAKSENLDNIKELVNQISHEIKNPLVAVSGFAQRIIKNIGRDNGCKNIEDYAKIIVDESGRLENLLNDLINFNRTDNMELKKISLYSILKKTINLLKIYLEEKSIELIFEYKKVPKIYGDPLQLRQAFFNLFLNAVEAVDRDGKIRINLFKNSKKIFIEIEDNGQGIPDKILHNIFNPFFTTKIKGTGLGLPITYKIIKNHNGTIELRKLKKGTVFTIKFPIGEKNEKENFNN